MKFEEIQPRQPDIIDEAKMSTKVFDDFIDSPEAEGISCGFEAELIFAGLAESSDNYDSEPEMDESDDRRPRSIEDIVDFFHDGDYNGRRAVESLRETLENEFHEWQFEQMAEAWGEAESEAVREYIEENDWDEEEKLREYMSEVMELTDEAIDEAMEWYGSRRQRAITSLDRKNELKTTDQSYANYAEAVDAISDLLEERVQESIDNQDSNYDRAREEWEENTQDDYDDSEWIRETDYNWMTDVYREHDISWPYWNYPEPESEGGYSEDAAERLGRSLGDDLDVRVTAASGYHSTTRRPGLWIIEPDSSLEADDTDDMPAEIISPPMPLKQTLDILPKFYEWAKSNDAYSNESTGFHIGVSLPNVGGQIDYMKLALFLGDQYVLDQFERGSNYFTKSSLSKLRKDIEDGTVKPEQIADTLKLMKHNLIELSNKTIKRGGGAHGKYSSINMKGDYIEFRSMGSESYFSNPDSLNKVLDTIKRYAYAMYIASRPELYRDEYAKKLYKLLDKEDSNHEAVKQFSDYVAAVGGADAQTVKSFMTAVMSTQYKDAPLPDRQTPVRSGVKSGKYWWNVKYNGQRMEVVAANKEEARDIAAREWGLQPRQTLAITSADITMLRPFKDSPGGVGNWAVMIGGQQMFRFAAADKTQAERMAKAWLDARSDEFKQEHAGQNTEVIPIG